MFFVAARALAQKVSPADLKQGLVYPSITKIRDVSISIATAVAEVAYHYNLASKPKPSNTLKHIKSHRYEALYYSYV
jgi:malate dehydrogenase (oxaloacetate-decarboxylating)(NADP+)